jgi:DNA repair protein RecO (recombination protein O)
VFAVRDDSFAGNMQWTDEGIVLGVRRHGEANAILELMTRAHGRHLGLVRGGAGSRLRPVLQPGNAVGVVWRARLDEHLGHYTVEPLRLRAAALGAAHAVYGVTHVAALARLLPERDPHPQVHDAVAAILDSIDAPATMAGRVARFELQLLAELGFGLDLARCAATGTDADLVYVSPRSGRAVSRQAGEPWRDKLLPLPAFLSDADVTATAADLAAAFALTGHFLAGHMHEARSAALSPERERFIAAVLHHARTAPAA